MPDLQAKMYESPEHSEDHALQDGHDEPLDSRRMLIAYGSETGNSQNLAVDLGRIAERLRFRTTVTEMNDVELGALSRYPLVIFVISTTGQGDIPSNAIKFWKSSLRKRLPQGCLGHVRFTTFGLGDSSYAKYNWAARKLHKRLEQLGAVEFFSRGEADERHDDGIDGAFLDWSNSLRTHLQTEHPLPDGISPIPSDVQLTPKFTIELLPTMECPDLTMSDNHDAKVVGKQPVSTPLPGRNKESGPKDAGQSRQDHPEPVLDRTAALFSHVDNPNHDLQFELQIERASIHSNSQLARLSEGTANAIPGGIDILDRPNVLRDDPIKYSLDDAGSRIQEPQPPLDLNPIPNAWRAIIEDNSRVTPDNHWQDVRLLTLNVTSRMVSTKKGEKEECVVTTPGDVVVIYPKNFPKDVHALIDLMGWGDVADKPFEHHTEYPEVNFGPPKNCHPMPLSTLRQLLLNNYDITSIPKRVFFEDIAFYTEDPTHQERLRDFSNPALSDEFYDYTSRPRRSILEVLQDFPTVQIPYQHIPSVFPVIRGREFSIASGGLLTLSVDKPDMTQIQLLVALIKYKTVLRKTRQGLCSRYLASLGRDTPINITIKERDWPEELLDKRNPLLAIGTGTGVAPIRSILWDRYDGGSCGEVVLFYGGRNRHADFHFKEDWESLEIRVITAFSRDPPEDQPEGHQKGPIKKTYVQDQIREHWKLVYTMLRKGAGVFVAGSSGKMPAAVRQALLDVMVRGAAVNIEEAKRIISSQITYYEDVWG
ncbi:Uu.00g016540.m01.CDS01 [Anthostomella pinea]|uniref:NADPH-dependent diflavin oxidoreductase 1 n=1 Tax=Anthostomella pinea TaxID=933095 RepID=A0AAI8YQJ2_9PEZI|nr:Uu.00g016540.m01.CDS01 [Anthostomella pinea]